jgi:xanthine dehydrogenase molybdopterin-binding subunit B
VDAAARTPGVVKVLTARDVPGPNRKGIVHQDQPVLSGDKARRIGDPAALVLAESREALAEALPLIRVDWSRYRGGSIPMRPWPKGAPLVHEDQGSN